jgi:hypothetical protein
MLGGSRFTDENFPDAGSAIARRVDQVRTLVSRAPHARLDATPHAIPLNITLA